MSNGGHFFTSPFESMIFAPRAYLWLATSSLWRLAEVSGPPRVEPRIHVSVSARPPSVGAEPRAELELSHMFPLGGARVWERTKSCPPRSPRDAVHRRGDGRRVSRAPERLGRYA